MQEFGNLFNPSLMDIVDANDELALYHYRMNADVTDFDNYSQMNKGLVVEKATDRILVSTSVFTPEYEMDSKELEDIDWANAYVHTSFEGTVIRVFNHSSKWFMSTHRKLNAEKSRWGSALSFGEMFKWSLPGDLVWDTFTEQLDPKNVYVFLQRNSEDTRMVSYAPRFREEPLMYYLGGMPLGDISMCPTIELPESMRELFTKPVTFQINTVDECRSILRTLHWSQYQGLFVHVPGKCMFKVLCQNYNELRKVRNNHPNILKRYMEIRDNDVLREQMYTLFPFYNPLFDHSEQLLESISQYVYKQYIRRYVYKQYAVVPPLLYFLTKQLRTWHLDRESERKDELNNGVDSSNLRPPLLSLDDCRAILNSQEPSYLYKVVTYQ